MLTRIRSLFSPPETDTLRLLSLVAEQTDNAVIITDKAGYVEWVNPGFTRFSGYTLEEVRGKKPGSFLQGPDSDPATIDRIRAKLALKESFKEEILNYTKDGTPYWLLLSITPILDEAGEVERFIAIETDINERRLAELQLNRLNAELNSKLAELEELNQELTAQSEEIRQAQEELHTMNEELLHRNALIQQRNQELQEREAKVRQLALVAAKTDNAVIITDKDGLVEWVNPGFTAITGYGFDEVVGKRPGTFLQGKDTDPSAIARIREGLRSRRPFKEEILNYHKDGRPYWLELSITPILDDLGEVERFIAIELDVTHRKQQEIDLQKYTRDISQSIDYASRIQFAILPNPSGLARFTRGYFLHYQPRDVLSGDFYWVAESEGCMYLAVADATGHGVPGALMSVLGISLLNQAVQQLPGAPTNAILDHVNEHLIQGLKRKGSEAQLHDGIDLALMRIDPRVQTLEFSGANRLLVHFRADQATEYRGDRMPVGSNVIRETRQPFSVQAIAYQPGDRFYAWTDGITDQYGGQQGRKLTKSRLLQTLTLLQSQPIGTQQEHLDWFLQQWRGTQPQLDDILIAGIEF